MSNDNLLKSIDNKLSALLAISAHAVFGSKADREDAKPEVILSNAGLENSEIAKILGKSLAAVQKTVQRSRK